MRKYSKGIDPSIKELVHTEYKNIRNLISPKKREGKTRYYTSFFQRNKNKTSEIWKGIRKLVNISKNKNSMTNLLDQNKNFISNHDKIVNIFTDYFVSIGSAISRRIKYIAGNYRDYLEKVKSPFTVHQQIP